MPFSRRLPEVLRERRREVSRYGGGWPKQTRLTEWKRQRRVESSRHFDSFVIASIHFVQEMPLPLPVVMLLLLHVTVTGIASNPDLPPPLLGLPDPFAAHFHSHCSCTLSFADSKWSAWPLGSASSLEHSDLLPGSSHNNNKYNNNIKEQQQQQLLTNVLCLPLWFDFVLSIRNCHQVMQGMQSSDSSSSSLAVYPALYTL